MKRGAAFGAITGFAVPIMAIMLVALGAALLIAIPMALAGAAVGAVAGPFYSLARRSRG